jgi:hypothetical protein
MNYKILLFENFFFTHIEMLKPVLTHEAYKSDRLDFITGQSR